MSKKISGRREAGRAPMVPVRPSPPASVLAAGWRFYAAAIGCVLLLLGAYANFFQNEFQFDDKSVLVDNVFLRSLRNIPSFFADARTFSSFPPNMTYRPLVSTTLAIDYAIAGGLSPPVFHASQLVLLVLTWALLIALYAHVMQRASPGPATRWVALSGATLFCVHVVNTETMNLMHVRSELLSTLGLVAAFVVYWSGRRAPRRWLSLVPVAVGAFAKIPVVVFAPMLFVWEYLEPSRAAAVHGGGDRRDRLRNAVRSAAPGVVAGVVLYAFIEWVMHAPSQAYGGTTRYHYALTQTWAWVHYLRLYFVPVWLSADTDLAWIQSWYDPRVLFGVAVIATLCLLTWSAARRPERHPIAFGLAWYMLGLLPASSVMPISEPVNDHRAFVANIGLTLAVVWAARLALGAAFERWNVAARLRVASAAALCLVALGGHAVAVHFRNRVWRTDETLWADVAVKSPRNPRGWMNYGIALMKREETERGEAAFLRALDLDPTNPDLHVNLGILAGSVRGDAATAERHFQRALELGGDRPAPYDFYARFLIDQDRAGEAIPLLARSLELAPGGQRALRTIAELQARTSAQAR
jgi:hypothetical protein